MYLDICMFVRTCMKVGRYFGGREMLVWWSPTCFFAKLGLHQKSKKWCSWIRRSCFCTLGRSVRNSSCWKVCFSNRVAQCFLHFLCPLALGIAAFVCFEAVRLSFFSGGAVGELFFRFWALCFLQPAQAVWIFWLLIVFLCLGVVTLQKHFVPGRGWWLRGWSMVRSWPCVRVKDFWDGHGCTLCSAFATCREAPPERKSTECGSDHSTRHCFIVGSSDLFVRLDSRGCFCVFEVCPGFRKKSPMTEQNTNQDISCIWNCSFFLDLLLPLHGRDPSVHVAWFVLRFKNFTKVRTINKAVVKVRGLCFQDHFYDDDFFY